MSASTEPLPPPRKLCDADIVERFGITPRLARDWLRDMLNAGAISKVGRHFFGDLPAVDAWVRSGGPKVPMRGAR